MSTAYREFIASGRPDSEWEAYREETNAIIRQKWLVDVLAKWRRGDDVHGSSIVFLLNSRGVCIAPGIHSTLCHDDTTVSLTQVSARGIGQREAKRIHQFVSAQMGLM